MAGDPGGGDAAAVLDVVREFFTDSNARMRLLHGPLAESSPLIAKLQPPKDDEEERESWFERADIRDLRERSATVDVRAGDVIREGEQVFRFDYSGPALLEKTGEGWRIVDFTFEGRSRIGEVAVGLLAEQEQQGTACSASMRARAKRT
jgi:hypothetical protein